MPDGNTGSDWFNISHAVILTDRSRISATSRKKFFATFVSGWESLAVVTKKSILVPKGVLDQLLFEIEMSKLNISGREFYWINIFLQLS